MPVAPKVLRQRKAKRTPERRPNSHQRGYKWPWSDPKRRAARINMLIQRDGPYCKECGKLLPANSSEVHIDHIVDHKGDQELFWSDANWQLLHAACHSAKTMRENRVSPIGNR